MAMPIPYSDIDKGVWNKEVRIPEPEAQWLVVIVSKYSTLCAARQPDYLFEIHPKSEVRPVYVTLLAESSICAIIGAINSGFYQCRRPPTMRITQVETLYLRLPEITGRAGDAQSALIVRPHTNAGSLFPFIPSSLHNMNSLFLESTVSHAKMQQERSISLSIS
jgi:hypothetical protein